MAIRAAFPDILRFSFKFGPIPVLPLFSGGILDLPRTELSSAASQNCFVLCIVELGAQLSSAWAFGFSRSNWAWPLNYWAPQCVFGFEDEQLFCLVGKKNKRKENVISINILSCPFIVNKGLL